MIINFLCSLDHRKALDLTDLYKTFASIKYMVALFISMLP